VKAFAAYVNTCPWHWTPAMVDEWLGDLRSLRELKRSTLRSCSEAVRAFCHFITDPLYEWTATCQERFGSHPVQVVHEWNTAVHVQDSEGGREEARVHQGRAARLPRALRRRGRKDPGLRPQGLVASVPRRHLKVSRRAALSEDERLDALGRLLTDAEIPNEVGVPAAAARGAAIRQQHLELPGPVVASGAAASGAPALRADGGLFTGSELNR
jgi:hypothetical protein